MLTFEINNAEQSVEVFFDREGYETLCFYLKKALETKDHFHLKTTDWGGQELSSEQQNTQTELVNHVKVIPL